MDNIRTEKTPHNVFIEGRKKVTLTAISDVISFDESTVVLGTSFGVVSVDGEELHILKMDVESGEIIVQGKIDGLVYIDKSPKKPSLFKRK